MGQRHATVTDDCFAQLDAAFDVLFPGHTPSPAPPEPPRSTHAPLEPPRASADEWRKQLDAACDMLDVELARSTPAGEHPPVKPRMSATPEATAMATPSLPAPEPAALATRGVSTPEPTAMSTRSVMPSDPPLLSFCGDAPPEAATIVPRPARLELAVSRAAGQDGHRAIERLLGVLENLSVIQRGFGTKAGGTWAADETSREVLARILTDAHQLCVDLDLPTARVRADFAMAALHNAQLDRLSIEAGELLRHLRHDLQSCAVWPIPKARLWSIGLNLDDHVKAAFPSAQTDVSEGGMCFGFGRYAACVFHMLRAADPGMQALARAAGITRPVAREQDWGALVSEIETIARKIDKWPTGSSKSTAREFFDGAVADAQALVDASRKLASGTRPFDEQTALHVCDRTTDFLGRLSERITETQGKALARRDFAR